MTVNLDRDSRPDQRGHPSVTIRVALADKACLGCAIRTGDRTIDHWISSHLHPNRVGTYPPIGVARIFLGVPCKVHRGRYLRHQLKLVDAIAVEVNGRNAEPPELLKTGRIKMGVVKVTKEQIDGTFAVSNPHLRENL